MTPEDLSRLRHDLRNPVNQILGYSELLQEEIGEEVPEAVPDLRRIIRAARQLDDLIGSRLSSAPPIAAGGGDGGGEGAASGPGHGNPVDFSPEADPIPGRILVVDDEESGREVLRRRLENAGHTVMTAADGHEALSLLADHPVDLVLLDVLMPGLDGFGVLEKIRENKDWRDTPVIMISALDEMRAVVRCIEQGAEDYLPKPFDRTLLRARISACLEKKMWRDQEKHYLGQIESGRRRLAAELAEASAYVRSVLPAPCRDPLAINWEFVTSSELGGDAFGYHAIDDNHFAIYLLDVCGHGVGAALLSVAALNMLRNNAVPGANMRHPADVLAGLNESFQMEAQGNMYFTIWYGVYGRKQRLLTCSCGGHPPGLLCVPGQPCCEVGEPGLIVGAMPGTQYAGSTIQVPDNSRLLIFSDGAYELKSEKGRTLGLEEFKSWIDEQDGCAPLAGPVLERARQINGGADLPDDLSVMDIFFPPSS